MDNEKSLDEWDDIFHSAEMYEKVKKNYSENFKKQENREMNKQDEQLMQFAMLFQGYEDSKNPELDDIDTTEKQTWNEYCDRMRQFRSENMEAHFTPESWKQTAVVFAEFKNIIKGICDTEPKISISLSEYEDYRLVGDERAHISALFPNTIILSPKVCDDLIEFEKKYNIEVSVDGTITPSYMAMQFDLNMQGKLIYIKKQ